MVAEATAAVLGEARRRGFLGPGPVDEHVDHAWPLVGALGLLARPVQAVDLGSGGGVPALILAVALPATTWALVESQHRRAAWLREAAAALALSGRVTVLEERAEVTGRGRWRGAAHVVTARSFGPPAVTAECAAPLLRLGGTCWVSEPPTPGPSRWPDDGLALLGLERGGKVGGWVALMASAPCPERYPRRVGVPAKRPLF